MLTSCFMNLLMIDGMVDSFFSLNLLLIQINEEASDKVLEVEQKYNEIRRPVYDKRRDIINSIPDFWLTVVSDPSLS